jgi:hypothetical protein
MKSCNQEKCENVGVFRFTWPGRDEEVICVEHLPKLVAVAAAMGLHLQVRPVVDPEELWDGYDGPCCE